MTSASFRSALAALGYSQRGFAAYVGANERTVRRWAEGEQDIPNWVPVLLGLLAHQKALEGGQDGASLDSPENPPEGV